jgi:hypothetical protein
MADTKISAMPNATTPLTGAELVPLVQDGVTIANSTDIWSEVWCGYDAPNDLFHRHNEAWIKIILH